MLILNKKRKRKEKLSYVLHYVARRHWGSCKSRVVERGVDWRDWAKGWRVERVRGSWKRRGVCEVIESVRGMDFVVNSTKTLLWKLFISYFVPFMFADVLLLGSSFSSSSSFHCLLTNYSGCIMYTHSKEQKIKQEIIIYKVRKEISCFFLFYLRRYVGISLTSKLHRP